MKKLYILPLLFLVLISCSHSKTYDNCSDMMSSVRDVQYTTLVKEWGEPYYKDEYAAGSVFYVKWSGVGVNGKDAKFYFDETILDGGEVVPTTVKSVECDPFPDSK